MLYSSRKGLICNIILILFLKATVSEATDSQSATARVVETPIVRRGGRGKGRKEASAKEIPQVMVADNKFQGR